MFKVLLIETESALRNAYALKLKKEGFEVIHVVDVRDALEIAKKESPDVIICDMMMRGVSGRNIIDQIKHSFELAHIPILVFTSRAPLDYIERINRSGVVNGLVKFTTTPAELVDMVKKELRGSSRTK